MSPSFLSVRLALRDWLHEYILSLCAVLALASMLTPLLVLNGVRVGLVESLRNHLLQDPTALILVPSGGGSSGYTQKLIDSLKERPDVLFAVPRTRDVAAELQFEGKDGRFIAVTLEPTATGDPLLKRFGAAEPKADLPVSGMVLSASAARKLGVETGQPLSTRLGRKRPDGMLESMRLEFEVTGILPAEATVHDVAFMPLSALEDIQDYRDYIAVPGRKFSGDAQPEGERHYESFRLYAKSLDDVEALDKYLASLGINVITKAKSIADIKRLDEALTKITVIIALAVGAGFAAFTVSSTLAAVRRKDRMLGMLRLLGFSRFSLLLYPLSQTMLTGLCGTLLAGVPAVGVAYGIDWLFSASIAGSAPVCVIRFDHLLVVLGAVLALSALSALSPALRASKVDPALVVRDV